MTTHLSDIQLVGFKEADFPLIKSVLADMNSGAHYSISTVNTPHFKHFGIYVLFISGEADLEQLADLLSDDGRFPIVLVLSSSGNVSVIKALRVGADDVFYLDSLQSECEEFISSLQAKLTRCRLLYERLIYREGLEASLEELKDDQYAAFQVQSRLLPAQKQVIQNTEYQYSITPSLIVSGDFVDVLPINNELTLFYLADVSGHGASSALVTVLLKNITSRLLRNFKRDSSYDILSPLKTLNRINSELCTLALDKHLTIFAGLINNSESTLTYAVGGHHPMPVYKSLNSTYVLEGRGMPVGLFPDAVFSQNRIELDADFSLSVFSDGVLELLPQSSILEKEQNLLTWLESNGADLDALKSHIFDSSEHLEQYPDDITIMTVSRVLP
ncbi:PP2C family protein-serine/threonine phosphatase [Neptunomonas japonica]|uniref:PP2C family protein-serine/threonine phosphatase n=1 Tax=Neptunomonas japonica TaxID=417574 RepID=UPI0004257168|nr:SpoIIE family protein phosphatase [Neptunomonas japonica]